MQHLHTLTLEKEMEESKRIISNARSQNQQLQNMLSAATSELQEPNKRLQWTTNAY